MDRHKEAEIIAKASPLSLYEYVEKLQSEIASLRYSLLKRTDATDLLLSRAECIDRAIRLLALPQYSTMDVFTLANNIRNYLSEKS